MCDFIRTLQVDRNCKVRPFRKILTLSFVIFLNLETITEFGGSSGSDIRVDNILSLYLEMEFDDLKSERRCRRI